MTWKLVKEKCVRCGKTFKQAEGTKPVSYKKDGKVIIGHLCRECMVKIAYSRV